MARSPARSSLADAAHDLDLDQVVEQAARKLKRDVERTVAHAEKSVARASESLTRTANAMAEDARLRSARALDRAGEEVRAHPVATVAAAAGLGLILGALLFRRS